jgi:putative membrane protein
MHMRSAAESHIGAASKPRGHQLMRLFTTTFAVAAIAFVAPAVAQDAMSAQSYVAMAASSDMFEIQSSQLALEKAQSADVKQFAQEMINDHTQTSQALMAAARQEQVEVPSGMMDKHAAQLQKLGNASSDGFDSAYMKAQVASHEEALALHSSYAENGESEPLKASAERAVPIVREHLEHVQKMAQGM